MTTNPNVPGFTEHTTMPESKDKSPLAEASGPPAHQIGEFWCLRPGKAPVICLIREVNDETPEGDPLPKLAIRFLNSGADFYFERWRELYAQDSTFVPVIPPTEAPNKQAHA